MLLELNGDDAFIGDGWTDRNTDKTEFHIDTRGNVEANAQSSACIIDGIDCDGLSRTTYVTIIQSIFDTCDIDSVEIERFLSIIPKLKQWSLQIDCFLELP